MIEERFVNGLLDAMLLCEETGRMQAMRAHIKLDGSTLIDRIDHERLKEFAALLVRTIENIDLEYRNGHGSLIKLNHPFNKLIADAKAAYDEWTRSDFIQGPSDIRVLYAAE